MKRRRKWTYNCNRCKDTNWIVTCGCGKDVKPRLDKRHDEYKYNPGHNMKVKDCSGENHHMWKGGHTYDKFLDHFYTIKLDHPYHNRANYVVNHRLVMEHYLKILFDEDVYIPRGWDVHHINRNRHDNSLINLEIIKHGKQSYPTNVVDSSNRRCATCKSTKTQLRKSKTLGLRPNWIKHFSVKGGWECMSCYGKRNWYKYE